MDIAARLIEGIAFVLSCIFVAGDEDGKRNWKWWLGRLCTLDRLMDEFRHEFAPKVCCCRYSHDISDEFIASIGLVPARELRPNACVARCG